MTNSSPLSMKFQIPEGNFTLNWVAPTSTVSSITITLKNSANQSVYTFSGSSTQLNGTIYSGNNDCPGCTAPTGFTGSYGEQTSVNGNTVGVAHLVWNCNYEPSKFKIYRSADGIDYAEIGEVVGNIHEYSEEMAPGTTYYYRVTAFSSACESNPALTSDNTDYVVVTASLSVAENSINAHIYPNPTTGSIKIEANDMIKVAAFNLVGQKVYEENINGDECVVNMKEFGSGIYMLKIQTLYGTTTQKVSVIE